MSGISVRISNKIKAEPVLSWRTLVLHIATVLLWLATVAMLLSYHFSGSQLMVV